MSFLRHSHPLKSFPFWLRRLSFVLVHFPARHFEHGLPRPLALSSLLCRLWAGCSWGPRARRLQCPSAPLRPEPSGRGESSALGRPWEMGLNMAPTFLSVWFSNTVLRSSWTGLNWIKMSFLLRSCSFDKGKWPRGQSPAPTGKTLCVGLIVEERRAWVLPPCPDLCGRPLWRQPLPLPLPSAPGHAVSSGKASDERSGGQNYLHLF